ncbi:MAG: hypothetical protein HFI86_08475 [Bacilli bacterium]|nr:hypothetical protein [Bacilli bacterium]MCI9435281.1 hypothetical protein [Bacilli bacterium]
MLSKEELIKYRAELSKNIKNYQGKEKIIIPTEIINQVLFDKAHFNEQYKVFYYDCPIDYRGQAIVNAVDLTDACLDYIDMSDINDFSNSKGVKINPQKLRDKRLDMIYRNFKNVRFIGPFDGCWVNQSSFKGSEGAKIDFKTIQLDYFGHNIDFADTWVLGPFDNADTFSPTFNGIVITTTDLRNLMKNRQSPYLENIRLIDEEGKFENYETSEFYTPEGTVKTKKIEKFNYTTPEWDLVFH